MFRDKALSLYLQDPTIPEVSKNIAKRMWVRCNGKTPNEINVLVPLSQYERKAYSYVQMVNMEIMPQSMFKSPEEAYPTFRVYLQKAEDNDVKDKLLVSLQKALENMPMWSQAYWGQFGEMATSNNNIAMSQAIQTPKTKPSRADVVPGANG